MNQKVRVLEADIKACFDSINHEWMQHNILMDRKMLHAWLKAGYVEKGRLYPTKEGTPQGGVISPVLANMTLDGLEAVIVSAVPRGSKVNVIRKGGRSCRNCHIGGCFLVD